MNYDQTVDIQYIVIHGEFELLRPIKNKITQAQKKNNATITNCSVHATDVAAQDNMAQSSDGTKPKIISRSFTCSTPRDEVIYSYRKTL